MPPPGPAAALAARRDSRAAQAPRATRSQHPVVSPDGSRGPGRRRPGRHTPAPCAPGRPTGRVATRRTRPPDALRSAGTFGETEPGESQQTKTNLSHVSVMNVASYAPACLSARGPRHFIPALQSARKAAARGDSAPDQTFRFPAARPGSRSPAAQLVITTEMTSRRNEKFRISAGQRTPVRL